MPVTKKVKPPRTRGEATVSTDGSTVWVNSASKCLARFGTFGFEIFDTGPKKDIILEAARGEATSTEQWESFKEQVLREHGVEVSATYTPKRLKKK